MVAAIDRGLGILERSMVELVKKNPWIIPVVGFTLLVVVGIAVS